jgi:hypothetical protein
MAVLPVRNDTIRVPGLTEILIAVPPKLPTENRTTAYTTLFKLGESESGVNVQLTPMVGSVIGDRHGGQEGAPIEQQFFGIRVTAQLQMSRYDIFQVRKFERYGHLLATEGTIPLNAIGALLARDRSFRVLFYCMADPDLSINLPCATWTSPVETGKGTKYAKCGMTITGDRAAEGYWYPPAVGCVYDRNLQGWSASSKALSANPSFVLPSLNDLGNAGTYTDGSFTYPAGGPTYPAPPVAPTV